MIEEYNNNEKPKTHFCKLENNKIISYWCCTTQERIDESESSDLEHRYAYANKKYIGKGNIYSINDKLQNDDTIYHFWA